MNHDGSCSEPRISVEATMVEDVLRCEVPDVCSVAARATFGLAPPNGAHRRGSDTVPQPNLGLSGDHRADQPPYETHRVVQQRTPWSVASARVRQASARRERRFSHCGRAR